MIYLIDMDGVLADFETGFLDKWREKHPDKPFIPVEERKTFRIIDQYPQEDINLIREIYNSPGFYINLQIIPGSLEAISEIKMAGHEIFICTSPVYSYKNCVEEKYAWIDKNLGFDWTQCMIMTRDKTMVRGDFLIDDKPVINGARIPSWEHIIYDQPYNRNENSKRRITWQNWKEVLGFK